MLDMPRSASRAATLGLLLALAAGLLIWFVRAKKPMTIVALGDSVTAGTPDSSYPQRLAQRHPRWRVVNRGVGGERTDQILGRVEDVLLAHKPDVVIVLAGINDLHKGRNADHAIEHLQRIYDRCRSGRARVMACTIMPTMVSGLEISQGIDTINAWIRDYGPTHGFGVCDLSQRMADPQRPGETLGSTDDGIHLTELGYQQMGDLVDACLQKWLDLPASAR